MKVLLRCLGGYAVTGGGLYYYGNKVERHHPVVEHIDIPILDLAPELVGLRIVALADFHIDPLRDFELFRDAFSLTQELNPDLIVLLGDYVTSDAFALYELVPDLRKLEAKYGVFACLGNHEVWTGAEVSQAALEEAGAVVLVNRGERIAVGSAGLYLAGLDSMWTGQPDLTAALAANSADDPVVLLMHEPDFGDEAGASQRVALQLSGHSHGGQVKIPLSKPIYVAPYARKYPLGLYNVEGMWLYTTRGVGVSHTIPVRINCPPEVTEIRLLAA